MNDNAKYSIAVIGGMIFGAAATWLALKFIVKNDKPVESVSGKDGMESNNSIYISKKPDIESFKEKYEPKIEKATEAVNEAADAFESVGKSIQKATEIINEQKYAVKKENVFKSKKAKVISSDEYYEKQEAGENCIEYCITADTDIILVDDTNEKIDPEEIEFIGTDILQGLKDDPAKDMVAVYCHGTYYAIYKSPFTYDGIVEQMGY